MTDSTPLEELLKEYRPPDIAKRLAALLRANDISANDLGRAFERLEVPSDFLTFTTRNDIQIALLAGEIQAFIQARSRKVAAVRGDAFRNLTAHQSMAAVALQVGMTKQAIFKVLKSSTTTEATLND